MSSFTIGVKEHLYRHKDQFWTSMDVPPVQQHQMEDEILQKEKELASLIYLERDRQR